jgi:hypothetical protein
MHRGSALVHHEVGDATRTLRVSFLQPKGGRMYEIGTVKLRLTTLASSLEKPLLAVPSTFNNASVTEWLGSRLLIGERKLNVGSIPTGRTNF